MTLGAMIGNMTESRPALAEDMSGQELLRWYWLRSELATLALSVGVAASGGKQELTAQLVATSMAVRRHPRVRDVCRRRRCWPSR